MEVILQRSETLQGNSQYKKKYLAIENRGYTKLTPTDDGYSISPPVQTWFV